jgi:SAM-dependent methyltransferase
VGPTRFFSLGETEIDWVFNEAKRLNIPLACFRPNRLKRYLSAISIKFTARMGVALDSGCGLGRLTQPMSRHFKRTYGVDISPTMIAEASRINRFGNSCKYILNKSADLHIFRDDKFDFIYTKIVLQHIPPEITKSYIVEFLRVLKPGGVLLFQLPSTPAPQTPLERDSSPCGANGQDIESSASIRQDPDELELLIAMHGIPREEVVALIESVRGKIIEVQEDHSAGSGWISFLYWVTK